MDTSKAHCNACLGERNHDILHKKQTTWNDEDTGYSGTEVYEMLRCRGCDLIKFRHASYFSEDFDDAGQSIPTIKYYPPAMSRKKPDWMNGIHLVDDLEYLGRLLNETYIGLQNNSTHLAIMGIRSVLEFIMIKNAGDNGSFKGNLAALHSKGLVTESQISILETILETGHAVIHRAYTPSLADLIICLDITESLIEIIYIHPKKAALLNKDIPIRKNRSI